MPPISKYFGGHGEKVMRSFKEQYGDEKGESYFYATVNKEKKKRTLARAARKIRKK